MLGELHVCPSMPYRMKIKRNSTNLAQNGHFTGLSVRKVLEINRMYISHSNENLVHV